jgi:hypothetical protein
MKATGIVVGMCVALLVGAAVRAAEAADPNEILKELDGLKKTNQELTKRIESLESKAAAPAAPAAAAEKSATPPGRFDLGGGTTLKVNGDVRVRQEWTDNAFDIDTHTNDRLDWTRVRTRLGFDLDYQNKVGGFIQLANEFRWGTQSKANTSLTPRDTFVDNAYIKVNFKELWDVPFLLTAGRQDLLADPEKGWRGMYGEGWLLFDGTPYDGSTSIGFDSAKLRFTGIQNVSVDFIYAKISDIAQGTTAYSPASHWTNGNGPDEDLYVMYAITKPAELLQADFYTMHRNKNWRADLDATGAMFNDPKLETTVFGGRLSTPKPIMNGYVLWALEGGYQTGALHNANGFIGATPYGNDRVLRDAYAFYTWARLLDGKQDLKELGPTLEARFDYLSGDDPNTQHRYEGWDSFYGEWPKYSELLIFNMYDGFSTWQNGSNPNLGAWSNLYFPSLTLNFVPDIDPFKKDLSLKFGYKYMNADEKNGQGSGRKFGDLLQFKTLYNFTKALEGHFEYDFFVPGNYFDNSANNAWFARIEMMYKF